MAIKVLMVGSEMVPYAATGGLGDVLGLNVFASVHVCYGSGDS